MTDEQQAGRDRPTLLWTATLVWAAAGVAAFTWLDWVLASFVVIVGTTGLAMAFAARNWDQHATYEEREAARARRRKEKWERGAAARARDRARWEAHQARQAQRAPDG
ncbi:mechanosensitive ion channel family protein [Blastococcus sp. PRF04-17]|uniref:mechanosensitive ion channel family protein n=1 Tax=Blastococcus sp. PRF04-17 TaxID=2933797 RepID=UPI001FF1A01C|nr:mechanosensitive ion channel family protein [Blastococcus sp. PRF04-17]UOY01731.1 mechanosensitive ion channel family protein [Blastococcus sp. PRF04-17]